MPRYRNYLIKEVIMKNISKIFILSLLTVFFCSCNEAKDIPKTIIPEPVSINYKSGQFDLNAAIKVYTDLTGEEKEYILNFVKSANLNIETVDNAADANLKLLLVGGENEEGYKLKVTGKEILVEGATGKGIFYGLQSLFQLVNASTDKTIPNVEIEDEPRFRYRGFMLDVSRHFASAEFVKKQLDVMAYYKLNRFHWHLTDGAGWRIEIKKYPELTEKAAYRPIQDYRTWGEGGKPFCTKDHPTAYGGYYTQEEIKDVVQYAKERFITVIPEIEMPGHSEEVLAVFPHLSCYGVGGKNSEFCIGNEATFEFLKNVLDEVIELFPSKHIHIGGDEADKKAWAQCPKCKKRMKDNNLENVEELQSYLVHRIEEYLNEKGRILLGWDEILEGGLAPNAVVMSWRGEAGGIAAAKAGHEVIMTPGSHCYFDGYQDAPMTQPEAMSPYLPLDKVYSYDPVPAELKDKSNFILGVQANLWREWIPTDEHTERMIYPRLLALAEVAWTSLDKKDLKSFRARVLPAVEYLRSKGVNAFDIANEVGNRKESFEDINHLALNKPVTYVNKYHKAYVANGDSTLTDGKRGSWSYGDGRWQGFLMKNLDVTIDLGEVKPVKSVMATFMQEYHAWISLPKVVNVYASKDGENFELLGTQETDIPVSQTGYYVKDFGWQGETEARYIRYEAQVADRRGSWVFTDEIIVQ